MQEKNKRFPLLAKNNPWAHNANSIWLGSAMTMLRNLEKFKFPGKLITDKRKQILSLLGKELLSSEWLKQPQLFKAEDLSPIDKEFLVEHFLSHQSFQQAYTGEAFILDETGEFLGILNLREHLTLQWMDFKEELENTWDRLIKLETHLNQNLNFAFSSKFGFLTSDPTQCGTGLVLYVFLHLPGLIYTGNLSGVIDKYKDEGIIQTGLQGNPEDVIGDIVVFHNAYTLGVTEENILSSLRTFTTKILVEEKSIRSKIKQENQSLMKDKVSRAYAILLYSYQLEAVEALNAISLLKLGIDLEWVVGIDHMTLNRLFIDCRRAHLICHYGEKINQEELSHKRADFIHQNLKEASLHMNLSI